MAATRAVVTTYPYRLMPADRVCILNASEEIWAEVVDVLRSKSNDWIYLLVHSHYLPEPYYVRLSSRVTVRAKKNSPWPARRPRVASWSDLHEYTVIKVHQTIPKKEDPWSTTVEEEVRRYNQRHNRRFDYRKDRGRQRAARDKTKSSSDLVGYYRILGCSQGDSLSVVKKAYRKLAFCYHPDRNGGDKRAEEKLKKVNLAWEKLRAHLSEPKP